MREIKRLNVFLGDRKVGVLVRAKGYTAAFQYDEGWLAGGFSISPLSLPLERRVFFPDFQPFDGLFGVFDDSLPDGWGRLLVDRMLLKQHINPQEADPLIRLAIVGASGMGALEYRPEIELTQAYETEDLDRIAEECRKMLETDDSEDLDRLFEMGGSSGGTRPKILTKYEGEDWIIKFPSSFDKADMGEMEYLYSECAKACGIEMTETRLFPSRTCKGYFGIKRFDRRARAGGEPEKIHMISAGGILETSHRIPNLDYHHLMKLTLMITEDFSEVEKLYRLMCFNVFAHNRDDHSRNFTYLYDEDKKRWRLSPAYDLTFSSSIGGEHATCVDGNGKNPGLEDVLRVAEKIGMSGAKAQKTAEEIEHLTAPLRRRFAKDFL